MHINRPVHWPVAPGTQQQEEQQDTTTGIPRIRVALNECLYCTEMVYLDEPVISISDPDEQTTISSGIFAHLTCFIQRSLDLALGDDDDEQEDYGGC